MSQAKNPQKTKKTEAEVSLEILKNLILSAKQLCTRGNSFLSQVPSLCELYSPENVEEKILDPLALAADLKDVRINEKQTLEMIIASNQVLKELWLGDVYDGFFEDKALEKAYTEFTILEQVLKNSSYKSFLKNPD
jgi:hypothetical protein